MSVRKIDDPHREAVVAVTGDLFRIARNVGASSLIFIMELPGRRKPLVGVTGRLKADPKRAIGELSVVKEKLARLVPEFEESRL